MECALLWPLLIYNPLFLIKSCWNSVYFRIWALVYVMCWIDFFGFLGLFHSVWVITPNSSQLQSLLHNMLHNFFLFTSTLQIFCLFLYYILGISVITSLLYVVSARSFLKLVCFFRSTFSIFCSNYFGVIFRIRYATKIRLQRFQNFIHNFFKSLLIVILCYLLTVQQDCFLFLVGLPLFLHFPF